MSLSRRKFIKGLGASVAVAPVLASPLGRVYHTPEDESLKVHLFSKHLHFLDIKEAAQIAAELGFAGLDRTP